MKTTLPPLPKVGERRLLKLIAFLEKLPRKKFNFEKVVSEANEEHTCATVACAIGWTPALFPKLVMWDKPGLKNAGSTRWRGLDSDMGEVAERLFGVSSEKASNLFCPANRNWDQKHVHPSLPSLRSNATPKQVAKMLRKYIALTKEAA
jgi:hypothetical protein